MNLASIRFLIKRIFHITKDRASVPSVEEQDKNMVVSINPEQPVDAIPKIIWTYWEGPMSSLVDVCFQSMKIHKGDFDLRILNKDNYKDYIDYDFSVNQYERTAFFADHLRLLLLATYGGVWLDASTVMTQNLDWVLDIVSNNKVDFIADYNSDMMCENGKPMIECYFLGSSPHNPLVLAVLDVWSDRLKSSDKEIYFQKEDNYATLKQKLPPSLENYLYLNLCFQKVLNSGSYNYAVFDAKEDVLFYKYKAIGSDPNLWMAENLLLKKSPSKVARLIKFTFHERNRISTFIDYKCYLSTSIIGRYIR